MQQTNSTERELYLGLQRVGSAGGKRILALQSSTAFSMRRVLGTREGTQASSFFARVFFSLLRLFSSLSFFLFFFEGVVMMGYSRREETGIGAARSGTS